MKIITSRTYKIDMSKADFDKYENDKDDFVNGFIETNKEYGVKNKSDVYSLLLNCGVVLKDKIAITNLLNNKISELSKEEKLQVLTSVDITGYSPLSNLLDSGNTSILNLFKGFINKQVVENEDDKTKIFVKFINDDEKENILTAIEFFQFTDITPSELLRDILKPVYEEESLKEVTGMVNVMEGEF